ncbi:MAG: DGQHR domain-containing protein [Cryobacterium sp.]|nr:DGQHR domain-containing protein [Cryobacterium sp.]
MGHEHIEGMQTMARPSPRGKPRSKRKPLDPAVLEQRRFFRRIRTIFTNMGFAHLRTAGKEAKFGSKTGELDAVYLFQNLILIVEDTTATTRVFDHAKNKKILADQILDNKASFLAWLRETFPEHSNALNTYSTQRFRVFFLYASLHDMDLDEDQERLLQPMKVVTGKALNYFYKLSANIRRSARTDLFRYLDLSSTDIGQVRSSNQKSTIETTIIAPIDSTGFGNGIRIVSFMISAETLLRNAFVLRKDNWDLSIELYQRLIEATRINKIRKFVASEGAAFLNNIIVSLPAEVGFQTAGGDAIELDAIQDYAGYRMTIPDEFNSICLIDGQHRVYAHYEGTDALEGKIAALRGKMHLLATGLVFPKAMSSLERRKIESTIFLDINSNAKPVPPDVLLAIETLRDPYADIAVARQVVEALNKRSTFKGMFQLSQVEDAPIKVASIIKFALRYLVDIDERAEGNHGLFSEWVSGDKARAGLRNKSDSKLLEEYVEYAAAFLDQYFGALKSCHTDQWRNVDSKITSTTVINGMLIALRRSLPAIGTKEFRQYESLVKSWNINFSKEKFPYASSQYNRFSQDVLRDMFHLVEDRGAWRTPDASSS